MSKNLTLKKLQDLIELISEYMNVFVWNYNDILGLDPNITQHHLNIRYDAKPIK